MPKGIYEAWKLPGGEEQVGRIPPSEAKPIGATTIIASSFRKLRIYYDSNSFNNRGCWRIDDRIVLGTIQQAEIWERVVIHGVDEFTFREAHRIAIKLAQGAKL